jgi:hypothetical protein
MEEIKFESILSESLRPGVELSTDPPAYENRAVPIIIPTAARESLPSTSQVSITNATFKEILAMKKQFASIKKHMKMDKYRTYILLGLIPPVFASIMFIILLGLQPNCSSINTYYYFLEISVVFSIVMTQISSVLAEKCVRPISIIMVHTLSIIYTICVMFPSLSVPLKDKTCDSSNFTGITVVNFFFVLVFDVLRMFFVMRLWGVRNNIPSFDNFPNSVYLR